MGHSPEQNKLSVAIVWLDKEVQAYAANPPVQNRMNDDIARIHNHNRINSLVPFIEDYTSGPPVISTHATHHCYGDFTCMSYVTVSRYG